MGPALVRFDRFLRLWIAPVATRAFKALVILGLVAYALWLMLGVSLAQLEIADSLRRDNRSVAITACGFAVLLVIAFRAELAALLRSRNIVVASNRIELTHVDTIPSELSGTVRDNFIHLGNFHMYRHRYRAAFEHYASAHRLDKSILTAFRCMQCLAALCHDPAMAGQARPVLQKYFEDAVGLADGPIEDLEQRYSYAEWVKDRRGLLLAPDDDITLASDLRRSVVALVGHAIAAQSDW